MLPVLVFVAETCVVTVCTVRTIFIARGWKVLAPILGFFEVSIWLFAIGQVMQNVHRPDCFIAFAGGFSLGNYLGVLIEQKLAIGHAAIHVTTCKPASELAEQLRSAGHGATVLDAQGATGRVQMTFTVIRRRDLGATVAIIRQFDAQAFYSVSDLQSAVAGVFSSDSRRPSRVVPGPILDVFRTSRSQRPEALRKAA